MEQNQNDSTTEKALGLSLAKAIMDKNENEVNIILKDSNDYGIFKHYDPNYWDPIINAVAYYNEPIIKSIIVFINRVDGKAVKIKLKNKDQINMLHIQLEGLQQHIGTFFNSIIKPVYETESVNKLADLIGYEIYDITY